MKPAKSSPQGEEGGRENVAKVAEDIIVQKVWEIYLNWEIGGFEKKRTEACRKK